MKKVLKKALVFLFQFICLSEPYSHLHTKMSILKKTDIYLVFDFDTNKIKCYVSLILRQ